MSGHKSFDDLVAERRAKMSPEGRAHFDGYGAGFKDAYNTWEEEIATCSLRDLLATRRSIKRRRKSEPSS